MADGQPDPGYDKVTNEDKLNEEASRRGISVEALRAEKNQVAEANKTDDNQNR